MNKLNKLNKRAQIFENGLVLVVFIVAVFAIISFIIYNNKEKISFDSVYPIVSLYSQHEALSFYAKEAGKLSVQEAYSKTLESIGDNCKKAAENRVYAILTKECLNSDQNLKEEFMSSFNSSMNDFISEKAQIDSLTLNQKNISIIFRPLAFNASLEGSKINVKYSFDISFDADIGDYNLDFNISKFYNAIFNQWDICKRKEEAVIKTCMNSLTFDGWNFKMFNNDLFCDLTSKKDYYFDNKLQPIVMKFKLEK